MDETYIQVKGKLTYFYSAVDKFGKTFNFMLSEHRGEAPASAFFARTNMIEQDHRFIKKLTRPMKGFKSFQSASATLDSIEVVHMIRKRQFSTSGQSAFQQFAALAA